MAPTFSSPVKHAPDGDTFAAHKARGSVNPGQDFKVAVGTPVYAPANGTIAVDDDNAGGGAGISLVIYHDTGDQWGWSSDLLHLSRNVVKAGDWVREGQLVGYSGNTGQSTGPHLHWTLRHKHSSAYNSVGSVDPVKYLKKGTSTVALVSAAFVLKQLGAAYLKKLQAQLRIPETGAWDDKTIRALQAAVKTPVDGKWGGNSNGALQRFLKITADEKWGPATTTALKAAIDASRFGTPVPPAWTPPTKAQYDALVAGKAAAEAQVSSLATQLNTATATLKAARTAAAALTKALG